MAYLDYVSFGSFSAMRENIYERFGWLWVGRARHTHIHTRYWYDINSISHVRTAFGIARKTRYRPDVADDGRRSSMCAHVACGKWHSYYLRAPPAAVNMIDEGVLCRDRRPDFWPWFCARSACFPATLRSGGRGAKIRRTTQHATPAGLFIVVQVPAERKLCVDGAHPT